MQISIIFLIFQMFCLKIEEIDWEYFSSFYVNFLKQKYSLLEEDKLVFLPPLAVEHV